MVDLSNCLADADIAQVPLASAYPDAFPQLLRAQLRLPRVQARRLYEILLLRQVRTAILVTRPCWAHGHVGLPTLRAEAS